MTSAMGIIFILGIIGIAVEDITRINKAAVALGMSVLLWGILLINYQADPQDSGFQAFLLKHSDLVGVDVFDQAKIYVGELLTEHLGDVSTTLFFVLTSMLLVNTVDRYGGFKEITSRLATNNKRKLLWYVYFLAFFFSALLDNLAASIVLIAIIRKLVPDRTDRMKYACMCVLACNAGGSWSPIGDVTTLLLWVNGRISAGHQVTHLFIPALVNMLVPLVICHFWLFRKGEQLREQADASLSDTSLHAELPRRVRLTVFIIGILSLVLVPVYQMLLGIPAFYGAIIGLVVLWVYTDRLRVRKVVKDKKKLEHLRITDLLHEADFSTILYFLGILMSVAALSVGGTLGESATYLTHAAQLTGSVHWDNAFIAFIGGVASSLVDNVALVAAILGMYPTSYNEAMVADGSFWTFLAYCAVTGGSLLIIGSGTGVTVMGLEDIPFTYYLKRFSLLALIGYISGALVYLLCNLL